MEYRLRISPRMLELLSKDLYTNLYFVLAELIANAYDADAENVYIFITEKLIQIEDDGNGMSSDDFEKSYLLIGGESRNNVDNAKTVIKKRFKMGRKGVGKLAALSISNGFKIITVKEGVSLGVFIPNKVERDDQILPLLGDNDYALKKIKNHGTAIIMENPKVTIPKLHDTILRNLAKIFPNDIEDFKIHVIYKGVSKEVIPDEKNVIERLATLIVLGDEKKYLLDLFQPINENFKMENMPEISESILMLDNKQVMRNINVKIFGWIGTYKSSRGMKKEINEFSDNYLAVFAHNKMGIRNILGVVGKNRIYESYIVGNLYIDAFENSEFPDMAGTNRQAYNESDLRWVAALKHIRDLTDKVVKLHEQFSKLERAEKDAEIQRKKEQYEQHLKEKLSEASRNMAQNLSKRLTCDVNSLEIKTAVTEEIEVMKPLLGFKSNVDANKKRIMISQTLMDKPVADIIYQMLLYNGVPKEDIIYSNGADPETNLPEQDIYGYLQRFFVESASSQMIYVLFVTSKNVINIEPDKPSVSWGELMEIGAAWVTKRDHWIFNIDGFKPEKPLNIEDKWVTIYTKIDEDGLKIISLTEAMVNSFCIKIIATCNDCGYSPKQFDKNKDHLIKNYISIFTP